MNVVKTELETVLRNSFVSDWLKGIIKMRKSKDILDSFHGLSLNWILGHFYLIKFPGKLEPATKIQILKWF